MTRECTQCKQIKPLEAFSRCWRGRYGRQSKCKECMRAVNAAFRKTIPPEKKREWNRAYCKRHPDRRAEQRKRFRAENPEKHRAHSMISTRIESGKLVRPRSCSWCGAEGRIEATHGDYSRPLDVIWLCTSCHRKRDSARDLEAEKC